MRKCSHHFCVVVDAGGSGKRQAKFFGKVLRLDIQVVQHFKVIGNETTCAHNYAISTIGVCDFLQHRQDVGANPWLGRAAGLLPRNAPVVAFVHVQLRCHGGCSCMQFLRVRVATIDNALG